MKIIEKEYKCAVCGEVNKYNVVLSYSTRNYLDFDMKPTESMVGIGEEIMECPNCHYANYNIDTAIEQRFSNNLELWNKAGEFQEIISNYSGSLRKILLVAHQYDNNQDYKNLYKTLIKASWICEDERASEFRNMACEVFLYKVLNVYRDEFLQITDLLRMNNEFDMAEELLIITRDITEETDQNVLHIINAEEKFIKENDVSRHNLSEVFERSINLNRIDLIDIINKFHKDTNDMKEIDIPDNIFIKYLKLLKEKLLSKDYESDKRFVTYCRRDFLRNEMSEMLKQTDLSTKNPKMMAFYDLEDYIKNDTWISKGSIPNFENFEDIIRNNDEYKNDGKICLEEKNILIEMIDEFLDCLEK